MKNRQKYSKYKGDEMKRRTGRWLTERERGRKKETKKDREEENRSASSDPHPDTARLIF
jgi:hypothetical protein